MTTPPPGAPSPAAPPRTRHPDPHPHDQYRWTPAKALAFLDDLARHGNVARAARSVGMTRQSAYRLRDRSLTMAQAWPRALAAGMERAALVPSRAETRQAATRRRQADARWFAQGLPWLQGDDTARQGDRIPSRGDAALRQSDASGRNSDSHGAQGVSV
ncbi:hypothetical protein [Croceibacterium mercuriale]|uniref:hypothetical protein n=1 Tax=Croceibacterium mercuriale TaxID=1572751 RepID=UPI00068E8D7D|nr:hypothetical protein [Croceibacterium mercuriale]